MQEFSCQRPGAGYSAKPPLPIESMSALRRVRLWGRRPNVNHRQEEVACL